MISMGAGSGPDQGADNVSASWLWPERPAERHTALLPPGRDGHRQSGATGEAQAEQGSVPAWEPSDNRAEIMPER